jgi:hypothetical protein
MLSFFKDAIHNYKSTKKFYKLYKQHSRAYCAMDSPHLKFSFFKMPTKMKIQVLYKTTTKCVHTNKSHGVHSQCLLFHVLVSKSILMLQVLNLLYDNASNILWKHVVCFRMNFMRIKYPKTLIN